MTHTLTPEAVAHLQGTLDYITAHPQEWDQSDWCSTTACGTTACVAGHLALRAGLVRIVEEVWDGDTEYYARPILDGQESEWTLTAASSLGIPLVQDEDHCSCCSSLVVEDYDTRHQLNILFRGDNDLSAVWQEAQALAGGRLTVPAEFQDAECSE